MVEPSITFLGGVREIGGNKILVEDGPERILFDFGPSFSPRYDEFYLNFLQPRSTSPVKDLLEFDLIPRVPGLYSREALHGADLPYEAPRIDAVFITHAHFDHAGYLKHIDPDIPVYLGEDTKVLLDAIQTSGRGGYGTHPWKILTPRTPVRLGNLEVVPHPVDHSIPGAYGYLVRTSAGTVAYTGDFRQHGPRAALTEAFLEAAAHEEPSAFITEGTRVGPDPRKNFTEKSVRDEVDRVMEATSDLVLGTCYPRDIDRIGTLYQAAQTAGRSFVVSLKTAFLLSAVAGKPGFPKVPIPGQTSDLLVYERPKKTYFKWEEPFLTGAVDAEYVRSNGKRLFLMLEMMHFPELIDLRPPRGSPFVYSMSEPFSEEDLEAEVLKNWLQHFDLRKHSLHASGHCSGAELLAIAGRLKSTTTFPIHTEHPDEFHPKGTTVISPEKGVAYPVPAR
ncbi:MAG: MBL fold metallo-hydrolase [Thermoplasmata archaeon]